MLSNIYLLYKLKYTLNIKAIIIVYCKIKIVSTKYKIVKIKSKLYVKIMYYSKKFSKITIQFMQLTANDTSEEILVVSNKSLFLESSISAMLY